MDNFYVYGKDKSWVITKRRVFLDMLARLKGDALSVFVGYHLFRAAGIYPTTRDIEEATGLARSTASEQYTRLLRENLLEKPRCELCGRDTEVALFHRHHVVPRRKGGDEKRSNYQNICKSCHNKVEPRKKIDKTEKAEAIIALFRKKRSLTADAVWTKKEQRALSEFLADRLR